MNTKPNNWDVVPIGNIVPSIKGKKPKVLSATKADGMVPYIDIRAFEKGEIRQYADPKSSNLSDKSDVLVVWDGARSGLVGMGQKGAIGSTIVALKPIFLDSKYLLRFLQSQFDFINSNPRGTGIPHVDPEVFWNINLPLAPLNEQRRIGAKLEKLLHRVDVCKERLDKIPAILKRFRQSVLAAACSGRLTADWREKNTNVEPACEFLKKIKKKPKYKAAEIKSWATIKIDDYFNSFGGGTPSKNNREYWNGKIPWVSSGDVKNDYISKGSHFITKKGLDNSSANICPVTKKYISKASLCYNPMHEDNRWQKIKT